MDWKKHWAKQRIEWAREDIKWSNDTELAWRKLLTKHLKSKHNGKWDESCERCRLWREIIENEKKKRMSYKQEIRRTLRGE